MATTMQQDVPPGQPAGQDQTEKPAGTRPPTFGRRTGKSLSAMLKAQEDNGYEPPPKGAEDVAYGGGNDNPKGRQHDARGSGRYNGRQSSGGQPEWASDDVGGAANDAGGELNWQQKQLLGDGRGAGDSGYRDRNRNYNQGRGNGYQRGGQSWGDGGQQRYNNRRSNDNSAFGHFGSSRPKQTRGGGGGGGRYNDRGMDHQQRGRQGGRGGGGGFGHTNSRNSDMPAWADDSLFTPPSEGGADSNSLNWQQQGLMSRDENDPFLHLVRGEHEYSRE